MIYNDIIKYNKSPDSPVASVLVRARVADLIHKRMQANFLKGANHLCPKDISTAADKLFCPTQACKPMS